MNEIDILGFDSVADAERGFEIELTSPDGVTGTGVFVTVLGRNADAVRKFVNGVIDRQTREAAIAQRKGKTPEPKSMDDLHTQNIESAAVRVPGWRNVKQTFDRDVLRQALRRNPHWIDQIIDASADIGNFSTAQPSN